MDVCVRHLFTKILHSLLFLLHLSYCVSSGIHFKNFPCDDFNFCDMRMNWLWHPPRTIGRRQLPPGGQDVLTGRNRRHPQAGPGARMLSLDEIGTTPGRACFSLIQIRRRRCLLAADKLMLSPSSLLLIFTFFIQTPTYYTFLESLWPEDSNNIVFNMF